MQAVVKGGGSSPSESMQASSDPVDASSDARAGSEAGPEILPRGAAPPPNARSSRHEERKREQDKRRREGRRKKERERDKHGPPSDDQHGAAHHQHGASGGPPRSHQHPAPRGIGDHHRHVRENLRDRADRGFAARDQTPAFPSSSFSSHSEMSGGNVPGRGASDGTGDSEGPDSDGAATLRQSMEIDRLLMDVDTDTHVPLPSGSIKPGSPSAAAALAGIRPTGSFEAENNRGSFEQDQ